MTTCERCSFDKHKLEKAREAFYMRMINQILLKTNNKSNKQHEKGFFKCLTPLNYLPDCPFVPFIFCQLCFFLPV